jgi:tricorn protease
MRRASTLISTGLLLSLATTAAAQEDRPFVRYPAISPDGQTIAFSHQGDIWTVPAAGGRAMRLTVHEAYEGLPKWSPDGTQLAFGSSRYGGFDLFVMGADGGAPRRITYHSTSDNPAGWTPDGRLLFETRRTYRQVEREWEIYAVSAAGGTPDRLLDAVGYTPRMSPDGRFIVFAHGSNSSVRRGYHGPANKDLWLYDTESGAYTELTDFDGNDYEPVWAGARTLLFISERDGTYNLYRMELADDGTPSGTPQQLTNYTDDGPRTADVSADGRTVVFERQTDIYVMDAAGGPARLLSVQVPDDQRWDPVERRTFSDRASEYAVSPDEKYVAFVVRGEIFVTANDPKENRSVRLTRHPYRDRDVKWLSETTLIFTSDREGQYDLYRLESADPEQSDLFKSLRHRAVRLTSTEQDEHDPVVSPDGNQVAFGQGRGKLVVAALQDGALRNQRVLVEGWATLGSVAWSPDSRWLAYSFDDLDFNEELYIHAADGSVGPVNVSQHPKGDFAPVWSQDGSKLGFISARNNGDTDVWFLWLRKADWEKTEQDWEEEDEGDSERGGDDDAPQPVQIDFDRIHERLAQVTRLPGNESDLAVSHDGETFYFVTNRQGRQSIEADQDLYSIKWDGTELKRLTTGDQSPRGVELAPKGKFIFMIGSRGRLARVKLEGAKRENLPFSARMEIDYTQERAQIFGEAWRVLNAGFYDPNFHGQDWAALSEKYWAWGRRASTSRDFRAVFNMMLGELNASHLGLRGSDRAETQNERTGLLGVEIDPVDNGVRVERVVPNSPADRAASKLEQGDVITAVDGMPVTPGANFYALLADRVDQRTVLSVRGSNGREREVVIRPTGSLFRLLYEEWVADRRDLTERYSGGRLGYIHIQGMNWPSFERFERELVASGNGKDGIVIDVRFNGGGWTTDYLMAVLTVRQHAYTVPRGAADDLATQHTQFRTNYPFGERLPLAAWTKPSIALCNANSFSNAEIFSHAFKHLGLGTLVGEPTFGAVISTGGAGLIDGSFVRLPFRGWFVKATGENMENGPAVPDIVIMGRPDDRAAGEDAQLRAAVDELLRQIDGAAGGSR